MPIEVESRVKETACCEDTLEAQTNL